MTILVLGASGMLGHKLTQLLSRDHDVVGTVRQPVEHWHGVDMFGQARLIGGVEADLATVTGLLDDIRPSVLVNAVGVIKQVQDGAATREYILLNALWPQELARLCGERGIRLIHFSTDCVFNGTKGNYTEADLADAEDVYGRTKWLGEVGQPGCITLRTSFVGWEVRGRRSLLEWFVAQRGKRIGGYTRAFYSGLSTPVTARLVSDIVDNRPDLSGTFHVASTPISKYDLLTKLSAALRLDIEITPQDETSYDRTLDASLFQATTGFVPPDWDSMIAELAEDFPAYERLRGR